MDLHGYFWILCFIYYAKVYPRNWLHLHNSTIDNTEVAINESTRKFSSLQAPQNKELIIWGSNVANQSIVFFFPFVLLPDNYMGPNLVLFVDNFEKAGTAQHFYSVTTPVLPLKVPTWLFV